ncbi:MAG: SDR family NAD(P)-dependent oxidoreductase, partial [Burkholderiales bacterium]|nr:SDR family NAD(P)-dependent oxidoreductase [Burkholderiales bacterium]
MDLKLSGRRALITGGSKGIGLAIARRLASEACHLHLVARSGDDLASVADELRQHHGVEVSVHALDLAERGRDAELAAMCP